MNIEEFKKKIQENLRRKPTKVLFGELKNIKSK